MLLKQRWQTTCASYSGPQSSKNEDRSESHRSYQLARRECSAVNAFCLTLIVDVRNHARSPKTGVNITPVLTLCAVYSSKRSSVAAMTNTCFNTKNMVRKYSLQAPVSSVVAEPARKLNIHFNPS